MLGENWDLLGEVTMQGVRGGDEGMRKPGRKIGGENQ